MHVFDETTKIYLVVAIDREAVAMDTGFVAFNPQITNKSPCSCSLIMPSFVGNLPLQAEIGLRGQTGGSSDAK